MKALLVDLDDTLLDYTGGVDECWHHACEAHAGPIGIDPAGLVRAIVETRRWFWSDPARHRVFAKDGQQHQDRAQPREQDQEAGCFLWQLGEHRRISPKRCVRKSPP